ncbi:MAG: hypothetical protein AAFY41_15965, partial [Bacteroidota bacterium]
KTIKFYFTSANATIVRYPVINIIDSLVYIDFQGNRKTKMYTESQGCDQRILYKYYDVYRYLDGTIAQVINDEGNAIGDVPAEAVKVDCYKVEQIVQDAMGSTVINNYQSGCDTCLINALDTITLTVEQKSPAFERLSYGEKISLSANGNATINIPQPYAKSISVVCDENVEDVSVQTTQAGGETIAGNQTVYLNDYAPAWSFSWKYSHIVSILLTNNTATPCDCTIHAANEAED